MMFGRVALAQLRLNPPTVWIYCQPASHAANPVTRATSFQPGEHIGR